MSINHVFFVDQFLKLLLLHFFIYSKMTGGFLMVNVKSGVFIDKNLNGSGMYEYAIKIQAPDGTMSNLSSIAGIKTR